MIDRYRSFPRAMSLRQMMDRLLEDAFVMPGEQQQQDGGAMTLAVNAYEEGDNFVVEAQLPGMRPEDIDVSIEHGTLTIRGEFQNEDEREDRNYVIREYRRGSFVRSMRLPETVDAEAADARFENGVLRLVFPKSERAKPRRISVGSNGHATQDSSGSNGQSRTTGQTSGQTSSQAGSTQTGSSQPGSTHTGGSSQTGSGTQAGGTQTSGDRHGTASPAGAGSSTGRSSGGSSGGARSS
jgi:HSP20 family protein